MNIMSQPHRTASPYTQQLLTQSQDPRTPEAVAIVAADLYRQSLEALQRNNAQMPQHQEPADYNRIEMPHEAQVQRTCLTARCCAITACLTFVAGLGVGWAGIHFANKTVF